MDATSRATLTRLLSGAGLHPGATRHRNDGIWCFGSRANGCASKTSDWDVLVLSTAPIVERRARLGRLDIIRIAPHELSSWSTTELAAHAATYAVRIDDGRHIALTADPRAAAPRKRDIVAARGACLERFLSTLQPSQQDRAVVRLRRDLHRAWRLSQGRPIPPTMVLDREWRDAAVHDKDEILRICPVPKIVVQAIREADDLHR